MPHRSPGKQAHNDLRAAGHEVVFDTSDDTGMAFSLTNWRYWLLGAAVCLTLAGVVMALLTAPAVDAKGDEAYRVGYMIGSGIVGLLCVGVVPGVFFLIALVSSNDRAKRGCFLLCVLSAIGLSTVYALLAGLSLAVRGTGATRAANEAAYKQAFETLDSYAASADLARDIFNAGGTRVKTLIGADTISSRIVLVNKLKVACAESAKLLETAEPTLDAWFTTAGVSTFARDEFWDSRYGHEYTESLKNLRAVEATLTASVSEYLAVMRRLNGRFAMADSDNVYFKDSDDLDTFNAAVKKLEPTLKAYADAQDRVTACKSLIKKQKDRMK